MLYYGVDKIRCPVLKEGSDFDNSCYIVCISIVKFLMFTKLR